MSETSNLVINNSDDADTYSKVRQNCLIAFCIIGIVISGTVQGVLVPLMTIQVKSEYSLILISSVEFFLVFGIIMLVYYVKYDNEIFHLDSWSCAFTLFSAGIFSSLMCVSKVYASNPTLVSPIIQSTLVSATVFFSFIFSKLLLQKETTYNYLYLSYSAIALIGSILLPLIYGLIYLNVGGHGLWILCYVFGVACRSIFPVLQEKYFIQTNEFSTKNKMKVLFYVNTIQLLGIVPAYGLEYVFGNSASPFDELLSSTMILFTNAKASLIFHGFVLTYFSFLAFSIYLNTISSNFIMIACAIVTPAVMTIFIFFQNIMPGIRYPLYVVLPSLVLSIISAMLWVMGERNKQK